jgi:hypothetical protein
MGNVKSSVVFQRQNRFLHFLPNFDFPHCQEFTEFFYFLVKFFGQKIDGRRKIEIRFLTVGRNPEHDSVHTVWQDLSMKILAVNQSLMHRTI